MNYTPLQVKTSYSILSSLNSIQKLVLKAKEYGFKNLAITDENNMFGVMEFYLECKKNNIKPIIGIELTYNNTILLLYAKNINGYHNLIKLATIKSDRELTNEDLITYKNDLILIMPYQTFDQKIYDLYEDKYIGYSTINPHPFLNTDSVRFGNCVYGVFLQHPSVTCALLPTPIT